jgi:hypothetical protein
MDWNATTMDSMRRIFTEGFHARDIAEPLLSVDATMPAGEARQWMQQRGLRLVGVRRDGQVVGFVEIDDLREATCGETLRSFDAPIADTTPLPEVVLRLTETPQLFVRVLGAVGGMITRHDLEKPPVRMWLFGMITLLEMRTTRLIEIHLPNENWREALSASRIEKAEQLREERKRRGQHVGLIDCLQITDKGQIIAKNADLRNLTRFESRRQVEQAMKMLESLRNNLAHSQDIISCDWEIIVGLSRDLDRVIGGTERVRQILDHADQVTPTTHN